MGQPKFLVFRRWTEVSFCDTNPRREMGFQTPIFRDFQTPTFRFFHPCTTGSAQIQDLRSFRSAARRVSDASGRGAFDIL